MGAIISSPPSSSPQACPPQPLYHPQKRHDITNTSQTLFSNSKYRDVLAERLSGAVKIPTQSYDNMGLVGEDPRWDIFYEFSDYLSKTFPRVYEKLDIETINEHAHLYTWKGSDKSLKPLVFMAHSDVVPASSSTSDRWTHPPFSGHYDGTFVWGRGSADDKCNVIAKLSAFEALLEADFKATRTVILALGFDEEGGAEGGYGARCLAERLLEVYGVNGVEMIVDEGEVAIDKRWGTTFAMPATAEKGAVDIEVTVDMAGGHSSIPPDHTSIGYLSQIIEKIEENQFPSRLTEQNPTKAFLQTAAQYSKTMDKSLRDAIRDPKGTDKVIEYLNKGLATRSLLRTSTAVTMVQGGVKSNALPETASALVNHRIAVEESVQDVKDHYTRILEPFIRKWNLTPLDLSLNEKMANSNTIATWSAQKLKITVTSTVDLEPSPVTDFKDERYKWLAGTLRAVFGEDVVVAPVLEVGNTDTKFYWKVSPQIYRINPYSTKWDPRKLNIHTVDERMPVEGMVELVKFYHALIRVCDEKRV